MSALLAGLPVEVAGQTVNRLCGSGLQAINTAAHAIMVGDGDAFVAGGVESMTRAPYVMAKPEAPYDRGNREMFDTTLGWRFTNPRLAEMYHPFSMGETGENVAEQCGVSARTRTRSRCAAIGAPSRRSRKAASRTRSCRSWCRSPKGDPLAVQRDEHPRADTSMEALGRLRAAFREGGTVTAGNSSGINDGASAAVVVSRCVRRQQGLEAAGAGHLNGRGRRRPGGHGPRAHPGDAQGARARRARIDDLDLIELNEAFASQSIAVMRELASIPTRSTSTVARSRWATRWA